MDKTNIGGQINYKGVNRQVLAAFSLFLQYLKDNSFSYIQLEPPGFQDFNLVFENGKKIICESKAWKGTFSYKHLRNILTYLNKYKSVRNSDEILIICEGSISDKLIFDVRNEKYYEKIRNKLIQNKKFPEDIFYLLPKTNFWIVSLDVNPEIIDSVLSELIGFWLPNTQISQIKHDLLVKYFYKTSESGGKFTKKEMLQKIKELSDEIRKDSVFYSKRKEIDEKFILLEKQLDNYDLDLIHSSKELSALSEQQDLISYAFEELKEKKSLDLRKWDSLFQMNSNPFFSYKILSIFKDNLGDKGNRKYVLEYFKNNVKITDGYYFNRQFHFYDSLCEIIQIIIEKEDNLNCLIEFFEVIKNIISHEINQTYYIKEDITKSDKIEEVCNLLLKIYNQCDCNLKEEIIDFISLKFNISKDINDFNDPVPESIYTIFYLWLNEDFEERFEKIIRIITDSYNRAYTHAYQKNPFLGWDLEPAIFIASNDDYSFPDKKFISSILEPSFERAYEESSTKSWNLIRDFCFKKENQVNKSNPDYLNRSVYKIVLRFFSDKNSKFSNESFNMLKEYILSEKGSPLKRNLIFQELINFEMPSEKKWALLNLFLGKNKLPINNIVEKNVTELAKKGLKNAKIQLQAWYSLPEFYNSFGFNQHYTYTILSILENDLDLAVDLLIKLITGSYVCDASNVAFSPYFSAKILSKILANNYDLGITIINILEGMDNLNENQQIFYIASLLNIDEEKSAVSNLGFLKIYEEILRPLIEKCNTNNSLFAKRFSSDKARELMAQFAFKLANKKFFKESLKIIDLLIEDKDPLVQSNTILSGQEPSSIQTVRGYCGWALAECISLDSRECLSKIIKLVEKLVEDENYYVVHMACFALRRLANARLKTLPSNKNILFFDDDLEVALKMAKKIEKIAFDLLNRFVSWPFFVKKSMANSILGVFDQIRSLNQKDALKFVNVIIELDEEIVEKFAPLLIYFAELRKNSYVNWSIYRRSLYDDLSPRDFDEEIFKMVLIKAIYRLQRKNPKYCLEFATSFAYMGKDVNLHRKFNKYFYEISFNYLDILANKYDKDVFLRIFSIIEDQFNSDEINVLEWFNLLLKCLHTIKSLYEAQDQSNEIGFINNFSVPDSELLELIYKKIGLDSFLLVANIIFSFPNDFYESEDLICLFEKLYQDIKNQQDVRNIIIKLIEKRPSKYSLFKEIITK